jgi:hypothetical protein
MWTLVLRSIGILQSNKVVITPAMMTKNCLLLFLVPYPYAAEAGPGHTEPAV